ncbi:MAG: phosphatidylserine decarboxylase family protein [Deltaproteobacteria bacterium]|nr:phosphatidylserine decarboxylase family protein [Deltaproteobacteria bacterium]
MKKIKNREHTFAGIAKTGLPFILIGIFFTAALLFIGGTIIGFISLFITLFLCWFFRDPERSAGIVSSDTIVSPADGKIIFADFVENTRFYNGRCFKISIFMSIFNVHVNRAVCAGKIAKIEYNPGKFFKAHLDKASLQNEYNAVYLTTESGRNITMIQIAGFIARRIVCYIKQGSIIDTSSRFGMICFGSRVDLYLPADIQTTGVVFCEQNVTAGKTILGKLK